MTKLLQVISDSFPTAHEILYTFIAVWLNLASNVLFNEDEIVKHDSVKSSANPSQVIFADPKFN